MNEIEKAFGFYPEPLRIDAGSIRIWPLPVHRELVDTVLARDGVDKGWVYAPRGQVGDVTSGDIRDRPFNARVFRLPNTHVINHATAMAGLASDNRLSKRPLTPKPRSRPTPPGR